MLLQHGRRYFILISKKIYVFSKTDSLKTEILHLNLPVFEKKDNIPEISVSNSADEENVVRAGLENKTVLVSFTNDLIIPLENIIAKLQGTDTELLVRVKSAEQAKIALGTLE